MGDCEHWEQEVQQVLASAEFREKLPYLCRVFASGYGVECGFKMDGGNWLVLSLTQPPRDKR